MKKKIKHVSSAGKEVNFDLVRAKNQMASQPAPSEVKDRQNRISARLRRKMEAINTKPSNEIQDSTPVVSDEVVMETTEKKTSSKRRQKAKPPIKKSVDKIMIEDDNENNTEDTDSDEDR